MNNEKYVSKLTEEAAKEMLVFIMDKLDELDEDDTFGTEGWRHDFEMDD
jgi:hypothetical protein